MDSTGQERVSLVLKAIGQGEPGAEQRLLDLVYGELRRVAHKQKAHGPRAETLQTTGLVHEAYLRLFAGDRVAFEDRRHFFAAAAQAMRWIIVDRARERLAQKRDWGGKRVTLDERVPDAQRPAEVIALSQALDRFAEARPRQADVVKFRYFLGLTVRETAALLSVSPRTVDADWQLAKAWLRRAIAG